MSYLRDMKTKNCQTGLIDSPSPKINSVDHRLNMAQHLELQLWNATMVFSHDITTAMLVYLNNGTAAMLVYPTNPPGIELYYNANIFFCFGRKTSLLIMWVKNHHYMLNYGDLQLSSDTGMARNAGKLIRCMKIAIRVTKCPLAFLPNFNIIRTWKYIQFTSQSVP